MRKLFRAACVALIGITSVVLLGSAPAQATFVVFAVQGVGCPQYTMFATYDDAVANNADMCSLQGWGSVARLAGFGAFVRQGPVCVAYQTYVDQMFYSLCKLAPTKARRKRS